MFKNLKQINYLFKECYEKYKELESINVKIKEKINIYNTLYSNVSEDLSLFISESKTKNKTVSFLLNNKSNVSNSFVLDNSINFEQNKNFILDSYGGFSSKVIDQSFLNNYSAVFLNEKVISFDFDEIVSLNALSFSFFDLSNNPIIPVQILIDGKTIYDSWMKKIKRSNLSDALLNEFSFELKKTKNITFFFKNDIDKNYSVNFIRKKYNTNCSAIFKIPYSKFNCFSVFKNDYTEYVDLKYSYSLDSGENFTEILFSDLNLGESNFSKNLLTNAFSGDSFLIKVDRGGSLKETKEIEMLKETELLPLEKNDDISFFVKTPADATNLFLVVDAEMYAFFKDKIVGLVEKTIDDLFVISFEKFKKINVIDQLKILKLKNQNLINVFETDILPTFFQTDDGKIYLPKCFSDKPLHVLYDTVKEKEASNDSDYTPILFSLELNFEVV